MSAKIRDFFYICTKNSYLCKKNLNTRQWSEVSGQKSVVRSQWSVISSHPLLLFTFYLFTNMRRPTIYLFIALHLEVALIFAGLTLLLFTYLRGGQDSIPIMTNILPASLISFSLGYLAGEYLPWEKLPPWARFWLGLGVFYTIFVISSLLGFYIMGLIYGNLSDDYWRLFHDFFFFTSILILLIGCVLGIYLSKLKKF